MTNKNRLRNQVFMAVLIGIASILHVIEGLFPPLPVPGAKLGLANTATLIGLRTLGFWPAIGISMARSLIGGLFGGSLFGPAFFMSFGGAIMSALAMGLISKLKKLGTNNIFVSVIGAITHSITQLTIASYLIKHSGLLYYLPLLLGLSTLTGVFIGLVCDKVMAILPAAFCGEQKSRD